MGIVEDVKARVEAYKKAQDTEPISRMGDDEAVEYILNPENYKTASLMMKPNEIRVEEIEPNIANCETLFDPNFMPVIKNYTWWKEMMEYSLSGEVESRGWVDNYLGMKIERQFSRKGLGRREDFIKSSVEEKLNTYETMRINQAKVFKRNGATVYNFAENFRMPVESAKDYYEEAGDVSQISRTLNLSQRNIEFDGYVFPISHSRHCLAVGSSGSGKSVTTMKIMNMCRKEGWTILDAWDSRGRMESLFTAFSLYDEKMIRTIRDDKDNVIADAGKRKEFLEDIRKLRRISEEYNLGEETNKVVFYHPICKGLPKQLPKLRNVEWRPFCFGLADIFEAFEEVSGSQVISAFTGGQLNEKQARYIFYALRILKTKKDLQRATIDDLAELISKWGEEKKVSFTFSGIKLDVDFKSGDIEELMHALVILKETGLVQPNMILRNGEYIINPLVMNLLNIVKQNEKIHVFSTKWATGEISYVQVSFIINKILELKQRSETTAKVAIVCREINEICPATPKGIECVTKDSISDLGARGRDINIRIIGDSQQVLQVSRELRRNIHYYFVHRITDSREKDEIKNSLSQWILPMGFKDTVSEMKTGGCYAISEDETSLVQVIPSPCMVKIEGLDFITFATKYAENKTIDTEEILRTGESLSASSIRDKMEKTKTDDELKRVKIPIMLIEKGYTSEREDYLRFFFSLLRHNIEQGVGATVTDIVKMHKETFKDVPVDATRVPLFLKNVLSPLGLLDVEGEDRLAKYVFKGEMFSEKGWLEGAMNVCNGIGVCLNLNTYDVVKLPENVAKSLATTK